MMIMIDWICEHYIYFYSRYSKNLSDTVLIYLLKSGIDYRAVELIVRNVSVK